jgi:TolA-binding protein
MDKILKDKMDDFLLGRLKQEELEEFMAQVKKDPEAMRALEKESAWEGLFYRGAWMGRKIRGITEESEWIKTAMPEQDIESRAQAVFSESEWESLVKGAIGKTRTGEKQKKIDIIIRFALAACIVIAVFSGIFRYFTLNGKSQREVQEKQEVTAKIAYKAGQVTIMNKDGEIKGVELSHAVPSNTIVQTKEESRVVISIKDIGDVCINSETGAEIALKILKGENIEEVSIINSFGSILCAVDKLEQRGQVFSVTTPTAVVTVKGTDFEVFVDKTDLGTRINVLRGEVEVKKRGREKGAVLVKSSNTALLNMESDTIEEMGTITEQEFNEMDERAGGDVIKKILESREKGEGAISRIMNERARTAAPEIINKVGPYFKESAEDSKSIKSLYKELRSRVIAGDDSAAYLVNDFVSKHGHSPYAEDALYDLGRMYEEKAEWKKALNTYRRIILKKSGSRPYESALFRKNVLTMDRLNDYKSAEKGLRDYLTGFKKGLWSEESLYRLIKLLLKSENDNEAMEYMEKYVQMHGSSKNAHEVAYQCANIKRSERDFKGALKCYKIVIDNYGTSKYSEDALYWAGFCDGQLGRALEENGFFKVYLEKYPKGKWAERIKK